jgi:hypothetical protein
MTVKTHNIRVMNNFFKVCILPSLGQYQTEKIYSTLLQETINQWANNANTSKIIKEVSKKHFKVAKDL